MILDSFLLSANEKNKAKFNKSMFNLSNLTDSQNLVNSIFTHSIEGMEKEEKIPIGTIENFLSCEGLVAFTMINNILSVGVASFIGVGKYGFGEEVNISFLDGTIVTRKNGIDCVVMFNNNSMCPDFDLFKYNKLMTEIDVSLDVLIKKSRFIPIPVAKDRATKTAIENALKNSEIGKIDTVLSENILNELADGSFQAIEMVNINDVTASQYIQYLTMLKTDLQRWLFTKYGLPLTTVGKLAQQSTDEINDMDTVAHVYVSEMLKQRQDAYNIINKLYDTNYTVELSDCWKVARNDMMNNGEDVNENE